MKTGRIGEGGAAGHHRDQRNGDTEQADQSTSQSNKRLQARTEGILTVLAAVLGCLVNRIPAVTRRNQGGGRRGLKWSVHRQGTGPWRLDTPRGVSARTECRRAGLSGVWWWAIQYCHQQAPVGQGMALRPPVATDGQNGWPIHCADWAEHPAGRVAGGWRAAHRESSPATVGWRWMARSTPPR